MHPSYGEIGASVLVYQLSLAESLQQISQDSRRTLAMLQKKISQFLISVSSFSKVLLEMMCFSKSSPGFCKTQDSVSFSPLMNLDESGLRSLVPMIVISPVSAKAHWNYAKWVRTCFVVSGKVKFPSDESQHQDWHLCVVALAFVHWILSSIPCIFPPEGCIKPWFAATESCNTDLQGASSCTGALWHWLQPCCRSLPRQK